jgi:hypothetical protein
MLTMIKYFRIIKNKYSELEEHNERKISIESINKSIVNYIRF